MDLVTGAMGNLLPKLLRLLGDEYKLQMGMKKQVKFISRELESIHAFLRKVGDVPWDQLDEQIKVWADEAREASYDMEDVLDTFLVRVEGQEPANPSRLKRAIKKMASLFSMGKARRDIGCAIQDIKNRLQDVANRRSRYKIDDMLGNPATTTSTIDPRLQAMYKEVDNLIGIDKPRDDIISLMSSKVDNKACRMKIVSILGTGGLGKTSLAKAVYDKLQVDFDCGAFVPVGRNPNLTKVLMDILYELDTKEFRGIHTKNRDTRQLIDNLRQYLKDKRYFIVIDDIWENRSWDETIEMAMIENNCGSRIIITTRNSKVATEIGDVVYNMQPLSDANTKKLFYTRIFRDEGKCPDNQPDEIPNKILKKCNGVPLAIITMASLLVGKPRHRWSDVLTSIGFGHKGNKQVENTMKILSYSYYDMPFYLRTCLLYLSVFPEDYLIDKDSLIWMWIAEGFIQEGQEIRLFELGEGYFNDLVNRSMIQSEETEWNGMVVGCRVHDMVLDLIRLISFEENFAAVLDNNEGTISQQSNARRLAHHNNNMAEHTTHGNVVGIPQVRSFIACRCVVGNWFVLSSYKLLRVLAMDGCKNVRSSHLVHLGNLLHLRYLSLEHTLIDDLPNEIGALKLLQILNLENTGIRQLTPSISRLTQLVSLKGDFEETSAPNWIGKLTCLEELQVAIYFPNDSNKEHHSRGFLKALGSLKELRVFQSDIREMDDSMERDLALSLRNLHKLQHLKIRGYFLKKWVDADTATWEEAGFVLPRHLRVLYLDGFRFSSLPSCFLSACLPNLTHLSLCVYAIDEKSLEFLGRLPELCYLDMNTYSTATIDNINAGNGYFEKLRFCLMPDSMIQFQCKEEDSSVSFLIWNGADDMPFGSSKNYCRVPPSAVMPNLEMLSTKIFVRASKDGNFDCCNIGLEYLPSLQKVITFINCEGATDAELNEAQAALRKATEIHPNRPILDVDIYTDEEESEDDEQLEEDKVALTDDIDVIAES